MTPLALSVFVSIAATFISALLGTWLGHRLAHGALPFRRALEALLLAPLVLPPTVIGYALLWLLGRRSLIGGAVFRAFGGSILFTRTAVIMAATIAALPLMARTARSAFSSIDRQYVAVARTLGATPRRVFLHVELPLAARGLGAGVVLAFCRSLGEFGITLMIGGSIEGETRTASVALYGALAAGRTSDASTIALALLAIGVVGAIVSGWLIEDRHHA